MYRRDAFDLGLGSPRVTVVVPCYNNGWSIERTSRSISAQRFAHFETIIVDDGSTDDLRRRVADVLAADSRFRVIHQQNLGLAAARNRGVTEGRGEFIATIDADDLWHPDFLKDAIAALDETPTAPFAYAYSVRIDEHDKLLPRVAFRTPPRRDFRGLLTLNSVGNGSAAVFRKSAMLNAGGYDESLRSRASQGAEDWKLIVQLAATGAPVLVERKLVAYRFVPRGMSQGSPHEQLKSAFAVIDDLRAEFPEANARWFADARTMMITWLMPALLRTGRITEAIRHAWRAYGLNPLWPLNPQVRWMHWALAGTLLQLIALKLQHWLGASPKARDLATLEMDGERPFSYLAVDPPQLLPSHTEFSPARTTRSHTWRRKPTAAALAPIN